MSLSLSEYQRQAKEFAIYSAEVAQEYLFCGIAEESGEVVGKRKKYLRGDLSEDEYREGVFKEMGDLLWYLSNLADEHGFALEDVAQANLDKLTSRLSRDVIQGDGDDR